MKKPNPSKVQYTRGGFCQRFSDDEEESLGIREGRNTQISFAAFFRNLYNVFRDEKFEFYMNPYH